MTTRREIEEALADKTSDELNDWFDSIGLLRVNPGGARTEEERRKGILKYHLDVADNSPKRLKKICRTLDLPTPEEKLLEIQTAQSRWSWQRWLRDYWLVPLAVAVLGGLLLAIFGAS